MPRRNIYVDDELDEQVKELDLPVSAIAQDALRREVQRHLALKGAASDVAAVAARLVASRNAEADRAYASGATIGAKWARDHATWSELSGFSHLLERVGRRQFYSLRDGHGLRRFLVDWAMDENPDADPEDDWFEHLDGDDPFQRGILEAVLAVLVAVRDAVEPSEER
jgi:post-segregation antitoxin (ccd killing protein)